MSERVSGNQERFSSSFYFEKANYLSKTNGFDKLASLFSENDLISVFSLSKEKIDSLKKSYVLPSRTLSNEEIDNVYDKTFLKIHAVERDIERIKEIINHPRELIDHIVGLAMPGFETLIKEYLFGKNTFFYEKVVFHPQTGEAKIVFYNPLIHFNETWEEAWNREDLRISYQRFIDRKSQEDSQYPERLKYRDDLEIEIVQDRIDRARRIYNNTAEVLPIFMSLSPAPAPSKYARDMGYATWWTKRLSHWRNYAFEIQNNAVIINASNVFTYRNIRKLTHLMKEVVHSECGNVPKIRRLSGGASDRQIMSLPFDSVFRYGSFSDLVNVTHEIDQKLNVISSWYDRLYVFSQKATSWHNEQRLTDSIAEKDIISNLNNKFIWEYFAIMLHFNGDPDPYLLKELLIKMRESALEMYANEMANKFTEENGENADKKERMKNVFINQAKIRERGGNCPVILNKKKKRSDNDSYNEDGEDVEDENVCILVCRGKKLDPVLNCVVNCSWKVIAEKDKIYECCPECGWYPGKIQVFNSVVTDVNDNIMFEVEDSKMAQRQIELQTIDEKVYVKHSDALKNNYYFDSDKNAFYALTVFGRVYVLNPKILV